MLLVAFNPVFSQNKNLIKLHKAVLKSDYKKVDKLLNKGISPSQNFIRNLNAIQIAVINNDTIMLRALLKRPNTTIDTVRSVQNAMIFGNLNTLKFFKNRNIDINNQLLEMFNGLGFSCKENFQENVSELLRYQDPVSLRNFRIKYLGCEKKLHFGIINYLALNKPEINFKKQLLPFLDSISIKKKDLVSKSIAYLIKSNFYTPQTSTELLTSLQYTNSPKDFLDIIKKVDLSELQENSQKYHLIKIILEKSFGVRNPILPYQKLKNTFGVDTLKKYQCKLWQEMRYQNIHQNSLRLLKEMYQDNLLTDKVNCSPCEVLNALNPLTSQNTAIAMSSFFMKYKLVNRTCFQSLFDKSIRFKFNKLNSFLSENGFYPGEIGFGYAYHYNQKDLIEQIYTNNDNDLLGAHLMYNTTGVNKYDLYAKIFTRQLILPTIPNLNQKIENFRKSIHQKIDESLYTRFSNYLYSKNGQYKPLFKNPNDITGTFDRHMVSFELETYSLGGITVDYTLRKPVSRNTSSQIRLPGNLSMRLFKQEDYATGELHYANFKIPQINIVDYYFPAIRFRFYHNGFGDDLPKVYFTQNNVKSVFNLDEDLILDGSLGSVTIEIEGFKGFDKSIAVKVGVNHPNDFFSDIDNFFNVNFEKLEKRMMIYAKIYNYLAAYKLSNTLDHKQARVSIRILSNAIRQYSFTDFALRDYEENLKQILALDSMQQKYLAYYQDRSDNALINLSHYFEDKKSLMKAYEITLPDFQITPKTRKQTENYFEDSFRKDLLQKIQRYYFLLIELNQLNIAKLMEDKIQENPRVTKLFNLIK
jgi:hypothetical protein